MRVLVACEFSGRVRDAFRALGHDAWSCDLLDSEGVYKSYHFKGDVTKWLDKRWDLMIAHPPCTHLAISGRRWWKYRPQAQIEALEFVRLLLEAPVPRIAVENPVSVISSKIRMPDQVIQPWQFGHDESKRTCLWLKNLPPLEPTLITQNRTDRGHNLTNTPWRWKIRSRTFRGIAKAMAEQWGCLTEEYYPPDIPRIRTYTHIMPQVKHEKKKVFEVVI